MKKYFIFIFVLLASLMIPHTAFASCAKAPSIEDAAKNASVIFIGTVTKITPAQVACAFFPINGKKVKWEKTFWKVDLASFQVLEAFKGVSGETIEIATAADGYANYKFEDGTWLDEGQTYLVYAYEREQADVIPKDLPNVLLPAYKAFPPKLAAEINELNKQVSPYDANVCGRTKIVSVAGEELEQIRKIFPNAKRFSTQADAQQINRHEAETATFWQRLLSFFGLA